jgi:hypothetical protein
MTTIPAFRLNPEPISADAEQVRPFEWAPPELGARHRIGGDPDWLQGDATPRCPDCRNSMAFTLSSMP